MSLARATELLEARRFDEALAELDRLVAAGEPDALGHRAWLHRGLGRLDASLADYDGLVAADPKDAEAAARRAETLALAGRTEDALAAAVAVLAVAPRSTVAAATVRRCHEALGLEPAPPAPLPSPEKIAPPGPINAVLDAMERDPASYPTSVFPEIGRFLHGLVRLLRPTLAIETGAFIGYSSICMGQALEDNGGGHLHSFDLFMDRPRYVSPVLGPSPDALVAARGHLERAGLSHRVTFHKGDSAPTIQRVFAGNEARVDFAFIDGDHTLRGALRDWLAVDGLLAPGAIVVLHDTMPEECGWLGPRWLMEELGDRAPADFRWVNLPSPEGYGLGVIQKLGKATSPAWRPRLVEELTERLFSANRARR